MKKLSLVAVAVCLFVGASFAGWDKFGVIDDGAAEAKLGFYGGGWDLNVRYGLLEKLELYSTIGGVASVPAYTEQEAASGAVTLVEMDDDFALSSEYVVGVRYQFIPLLSGFLDLALPTTKDKGSYDFGLRPGVNVTADIIEGKLSFGSVLQGGITLAPDSIDVAGKKEKNGGPIIDLKVGVEFDYMFSDNIGAWLGFDFVYDDMMNSLPWHGGDAMDAAGLTRKFNAAGAVTPGFGFFFTKDALTVGTLLEFDLAHLTGGVTDGVADKTIGLKGGVEFAVKF